jgi:hypothetical protein
MKGSRKEAKWWEIMGWGVRLLENNINYLKSKI